MRVIFLKKMIERFVLKLRAFSIVRNTLWTVYCFKHVCDTLKVRTFVCSKHACNTSKFERSTFETCLKHCRLDLYKKHVRFKHTRNMTVTNMLKT